MEAIRSALWGCFVYKSSFLLLDYFLLQIVLNSIPSHSWYSSQLDFAYAQRTATVTFTVTCPVYAVIRIPTLRQA